MIFSKRGFIKPEATFAQYGFVTRDGKYYIQVLISKYGNNVPCRTMHWRDIKTWDTIKAAKMFKKEHDENDEWMLVKVEGLLLNFTEEDANG